MTESAPHTHHRRSVAAGDGTAAPSATADAAVGRIERRPNLWRGVALAAVVAGASGAVIAFGQLLVPAQVPADRFSAPFDTAPFATVQVLLCIHHLVMAAVVVAVRRSGA